jgi:hypothetical protein
MLEDDMKTSKKMNPGISRHDYGPALQGALSWLGDRYLLAEPLNRRVDERKAAAREPDRPPGASLNAGVMA